MGCRDADCVTAEAEEYGGPLILLALVGGISVLVWLGVFFHPARPWDFQLVGEDLPAASPLASPASPEKWPTVCALIPARNEALSLPATLPALLQQEYPGLFSVILIDDRSADDTAAVARTLAEQTGATDQLTVVAGTSLPSGWVGKMWALEQGATRCGFGDPTDSLRPDYLLLTDADIWHAPDSVQRLVVESEAAQLGLNSRMAHLRCVSRSEHFLIPPFVFFFNLLYPMRWVNDPHKTVAAAAGGCVLLSADALVRIGGFQTLRAFIIDDVNLGRRVKQAGFAIRLSLSRAVVKSVRAYETVYAIWSMVRRTAFTELNYSWLRLAGTLFGMGITFVVPPLWFIGGTSICLGIWIAGAGVSCQPAFLLMAEGAFAWAFMTRVYLPAVRFFGLPLTWAWTLPFAAVLYEAMTLDSALRYATKRQIDWR